MTMLKKTWYTPVDQRDISIGTHRWTQNTMLIDIFMAQRQCWRMAKNVVEWCDALQARQLYIYPLLGDIRRTDTISFDAEWCKKRN